MTADGMMLLSIVEQLRLLDCAPTSLGHMDEDQFVCSANLAHVLVVRWIFDWPRPFRFLALSFRMAGGSSSKMHGFDRAELVEAAGSQLFPESGAGRVESPILAWSGKPQHRERKRQKRGKAACTGTGKSEDIHQPCNSFVKRARFVSECGELAVECFRPY